MADYRKKEIHIFSLEGQKFLFEVNTLRAYKIDDLIEMILTGMEEISLDSVLNRFGKEYEKAELAGVFNELIEEQVLIKIDEGLKETDVTKVPSKKVQKELLVVSDALLYSIFQLLVI